MKIIFYNVKVDEIFSSILCREMAWIVSDVTSTCRRGFKPLCSVKATKDEYFICSPFKCHTKRFVRFFLTDLIELHNSN